MKDLIPKPAHNPRPRSSTLSEDAGPTIVNRQLRELFREAFDNMGGAEWLIQFATANDQNARVFVQAISKLLPPNAAENTKAPVIIDVPWLTRDRLSYKETSDATVISISEK